MREAHVPGTFDRLDIGSRARATNIETFRRAQMDLASQGLVVVPQETHGGSHIARAVLPAVAILGLVAACGPAKGGETQIQPPPAQATEMASPTAVPTVAPTEAPKPTATVITEQLTRQEALNQMRGLIGKVQNPDRELIVKHGITQDQLKSNGDYLLQGAPDRLIPGLIDVRVSIEQGDLSLAHKQLVDVFTNWLWGRTIVTDDSILLSNEEKVQADPENRYFGLKPRVVPRFSAVRKEVAIDSLKMLYGLYPYTAGK